MQTEDQMAFDRWLHRDLAALYGHVLHERLPDEIADLLDAAPETVN